MTKTTELARNTHFSEAEIDQSLIALALYSGNGRRARKYLEGNAVGMERLPSARTLSRWHTEHHDRYLEIQREVVDKVKATQAGRHDLLADSIMELCLKLHDRLRKNIDEIPPRDVPGAIRNLATASGIDRDKAAMLRGESEPRISVNLSVGELIRELSGGSDTRFYNERGEELTPEEAERQVIDGQATELPRNAEGESDANRTSTG